MPTKYLLPMSRPALITVSIFTVKGKEIRSWPVDGQRGSFEPKAISRMESEVPSESAACDFKVSK